MEKELHEVAMHPAPFIDERYGVPVEPTDSSLDAYILQPLRVSEK